MDHSVAGPARRATNSARRYEAQVIDLISPGLYGLFGHLVGVMG